MAVIEHRPANGGGSCARCRASLGLTATKVDGIWYCGYACAEGRSAGGPRSPSVPEDWLYGRPRRRFQGRRPRELNCAEACE
jgi:hypothetical protein